MLRWWCYSGSPWTAPRSTIAKQRRPQSNVGEPNLDIEIQRILEIWSQSHLLLYLFILITCDLQDSSIPHCTLLKAQGRTRLLVFGHQIAAAKKFQPLDDGSRRAAQLTWHKLTMLLAQLSHNHLHQEVTQTKWWEPATIRWTWMIAGHARYCGYHSTVFLHVFTLHVTIFKTSWNESSARNDSPARNDSSARNDSHDNHQQGMIHADLIDFLVFQSDEVPPAVVSTTGP